MQVNEFEGGEVLQVSTSLVVFGDRFGDWPLYAKAWHDFYGGAYYNDVSLQMEDPKFEKVTNYAQLRLLFWTSFMDLKSNAMV
jgi:hypothetical protein